MNRRSLRRLALIAAGFALPILPAGASSTQLSAGHPFSTIDFAFSRPQLSPNGLYAVYVQDAVTDGALELWSVPLAGGDPVRLSDVLAPGQHVSFAIASNSSRVVFQVDQDTPGKSELYSVPIAGGAATKLNAALGTGRNVLAFAISPAGDRVFYSADKTTDNVFELYTVPIAGGSSTRLSPARGSNWDVDAFRISPDGTTVVFTMVATAFGEGELWSTPTAGTHEDAVQISPALNSGGAVDSSFLITANSATVVYRADAHVDEAYELFAVPIGGGTPTQLSGALPAGAAVATGFLLNPSGSRVIYRADQAATFVYQLYSVPISGGTATTLNGPISGSEDVATGFQISANGLRVIYRSDEEVDGVDELWSVPVSGGTPVKLNAPLVAGGDVLDFAISPNSARVIYRADQAVDTLNELWSVPLTGGAAVQLNRTLVSGGDVANYRISPNSSWVVYGADQDTDGIDELLRAPIAGGTVENVSGIQVPGGEVTIANVQGPVYEISPVTNYDVLYGADEDVDGEVELYLSGTPEEEPADACTPNDHTLCLQNDKFKVTVDWHDFQGHSGQGRATTLSNESGDFWFFNAQSNELIVKIINGCGSTGSYWIFWRALSNVEMDLVIQDTGTLQTLAYHNPLGFSSNGHLDIDSIFRCDGSGPAAENVDTSVDLPAPGVPQLVESSGSPSAGCVPDIGGRWICLQNGRFRVEGTWSDFAGGSGLAHMIKKNEASGYAWFFNGNNYEMLFKLVDACSFNGNTWVSIAGLTNVAVTLTIVDTWSGDTYTQQNALGVDFPTNLDIETNLDYCGPAPN